MSKESCKYAGFPDIRAGISDETSEMLQLCRNFTEFARESSKMM